MGKVAKLLPEEYKQRAITNGISLQTVYQRIQRGWDLEEAVTKKPKSSYITNVDRSETGELKSTGRPKNDKVYAFTTYEDNQELLEKAIAQSGKPQSVFFADIIDSWLKRNKKKIK